MALFKLVCWAIIFLTKLHFPPRYYVVVKIYRGPDAVNRFMWKMLDKVKWCNNIKKEHFKKRNTD